MLKAGFALFCALVGLSFLVLAFRSATRDDHLWDVGLFGYVSGVAFLFAGILTVDLGLG